MYNVLYMTRRLIIVGLAVFFGEYPAGQVVIMTLHSFLMIIYLSTVKPFESRFLNRLEIFNECIVLIASYHLFIFTKFTSDPNTQYQVGWSFIGFALICIASNMLILLAGGFMNVKRHLMRLIRRIKRYYKLKNGDTVPIQVEINAA